VLAVLKNGALSKISLNFFDRMPVDSQMVGHIGHRHVPAQLLHVPLEPLGVSPIRPGKADLHLTGDPTSQAEHPLNGKLDHGTPQTNGHRQESPQNRSLLLDVGAPAGGTAKAPWILTDLKDRPSLLETSMDVMHSAFRNAKTVVEYACGHAFLAFSD
jgi:hypothetical protein